MRLHNHTQQTIENNIRHIEADQVTKLVYAHHDVKNRRIAEGETVDPFRYERILLTEGVLKVVGFPTHQGFA
jgi:hypothetical protein